MAAGTTGATGALTAGAFTPAPGRYQEKLEDQIGRASWWVRV